MFDNLLNSNDPLVRYGFAAAVVWGGLYFLATVGIMSVGMARFIAFIALGWFLLRNADVIATRIT